MVSFDTGFCCCIYFVLGLFLGGDETISSRVSSNSGANLDELFG